MNCFFKNRFLIFSFIAVSLFILGVCEAGNYPGWAPGPENPHSDPLNPPFSPHHNPSFQAPLSEDKSSSINKLILSEDEIAGKCRLQSCKGAQIFLEAEGKTTQIFNLDSNGDFHFKNLEASKSYNLKLVPTDGLAPVLKDNIHTGKYIEFTQGE